MYFVIHDCCWWQCVSVILTHETDVRAIWYAACLYIKPWYCCAVWHCYSFWKPNFAVTVFACRWLFVICCICMICLFYFHINALFCLKTEEMFWSRHTYGPFLDQIFRIKLSNACFSLFCWSSQAVVLCHWLVNISVFQFFSVVSKTSLAEGFETNKSDPEPSSLVLDVDVLVLPTALTKIWLKACSNCMYE